MRIRITPAYTFSFLLLLIVMMELHELAHITVGRWLCGCWGPRDFNVWNLCEGCDDAQPYAWVATLTGPLFSFAMMYLGVLWLRSIDPIRKSIGLSLIFANIPFGRITTVMWGGGDEMVVLRSLLPDSFDRTDRIIIGSILILIVGVPPIYKAYLTVSNRRSWIYILGFMTLPLAFLLVYTLIGLNTLLQSGFLSAPWIPGTPLLITVHTTIAAVLLILFRKKIGALAD
jgi:hypothetical protein